jgi:hypothetical protein
MGSTALQAKSYGHRERRGNVLRRRNLPYRNTQLAAAAASAATAKSVLLTATNGKMGNM